MREELHAAALAALAAVPGLAGAFGAAPVRAALPHAVVEEPMVGDWSTKDQAGREARLTVVLRDAGEVPARARRLTDAIETALLALPRELGSGWRIASLVPVRSRLLGEGAGRWAALIEIRVRALKD